jgi:hypothetical protein
MMDGALRLVGIVAALCLCSATPACSRKPTVTLRERVYLEVPATTKAAEKVSGVFGSAEETEAVLKKYAMIQRPDFLTNIDFRHEVVIIHPDAEITGTKVEPLSGLGLIYVRPVSTPGIGIAVASGNGMEKLGKFVEEKRPSHVPTPGRR